MDKKALGSFGERRAAAYLRRKGFKIVQMNYKCRAGEIDIIAQDKDYIVFAEVKLRKNSDFAEAREFVNYSKQQRIIKTAQLWLCEHEECRLQPRFDVLEIYAPAGSLGAITINHLENAFM